VPRHHGGDQTLPGPWGGGLRLAVRYAVRTFEYVSLPDRIAMNDREQRGIPRERRR
jgi:hypothetical protein